MAGRTYTLHFDGCFHSAANVRKLRRVAKYLPQTYLVLDELAPWRNGKWPTRVRCMSKQRIVEGRSKGAGHGFTYVEGQHGGKEIFLNPFMTWEGYLIVLIHENMHHAFPDASESEINNVLVPEVVTQVLGPKDSEWYRRHGLGPPQPGIGDRGYVR